MDGKVRKPVKCTRFKILGRKGLLVIDVSLVGRPQARELHIINICSKVYCALNN